MKKPRCGTEPAWELFRSDIIIITSYNTLSRGTILTNMRLKLGTKLSKKQKREIEKVVRKFVKEYRETLKMLARS